MVFNYGVKAQYIIPLDNPWRVGLLIDLEEVVGGIRFLGVRSWGKGGSSLLVQILACYKVPTVAGLIL